MSKKPEDFRGIRMWGESLGSYEYYIKAEQEKAARMDAPTDAL